MSETKINSSLSNKFKKTQVNSVQKLPDITGHTLGEFYVDSRLDIVSGEADIYLCSGTGSHSGKKFLLKYYRRENAVKPDVLEKLKGVNSPFVAPVEGFGEYQGHQYVVRPYYEMSALSELLAEGTRFSEEELKTLIIPSIIEGLKAVHDAGILHKDLKPANLIPDDAGEHIVLIDFGISTDTGKNTFVVTQTGMTPLYAAPEAMQGIFHRETDYYALGITIFELFTGFTPFQNPGLSPEDVARLASISKIEFPEGFPEDLKKMVLGLTYKDISHRNEKDNPNRRWGYDEVRRWLNGEDVPVPSSGEISEAVSKAFPPYRFNEIICSSENELIKALITNPEQGIQELGRGFLTHHYFAVDERKGRLCEKAEKLIENSSNKVKDFINFLYKLAPTYDGFGTAVFGDNEYEFKKADDFMAYMDKLHSEGNVYELNYLFNNYGKAIKEICNKVWSSDVYAKLEQYGNLEKTNFIVIDGIKYSGSLLLRKGDYLKFGSYPQNDENRKDPIEWLVMEVTENKAFLISRNALDCRSYSRYASLWNDCDLRKWLNDDFFKVAFSEDEKMRVIVSHLSNDWKKDNSNSNIRYDFITGDKTWDRVFCLSIEEVEQYLNNNEERQCQPTEYALKQGVKVDKKKRTVVVSGD